MSKISVDILTLIPKRKWTHSIMSSQAKRVTERSVFSTTVGKHTRYTVERRTYSGINLDNTHPSSMPLTTYCYTVRKIEGGRVKAVLDSTDNIEVPTLYYKLAGGKEPKVW